MKSEGRVNCVRFIAPEGTKIVDQEKAMASARLRRWMKPQEMGFVLTKNDAALEKVRGTQQEMR